MDPFVWDEAKNAENIALRGFGFEIVYRIEWSKAPMKEDDRFDYGERRYFAVSRVDGKPYYVVLVPRDGTVRVLSARRMHEKEARHYGI
jgi:uncharacterized DUF497 family protein